VGGYDCLCHLCIGGHAAEGKRKANGVCDGLEGRESGSEMENGDGGEWTVENGRDGNQREVNGIDVVEENGNFVHHMKGKGVVEGVSVMNDDRTALKAI
jgi:hypothetical protein